MTRFKVAHKIAVLVTVVIASLLSLFTIAIDTWVRRDTDRRLDAELQAARRIVGEFLAARIERLQRLCGSSAEAPRFKAAVEVGDPDTVAEAARDEVSIVQADAAFVTDRQGRRLAWVGPVDAGPGPAAGRVVAEAAARRPATDLWLMGGALYQVAAQPICFGADVSGTMALGSRIDDALARRLAALAQCEVVVAAGGRVLAASMGGDMARELVAAAGPRAAGPGRVPPAAAPRGGAGGPPIRTVQVGRGHSKVLAVPLSDVGGTTVATVLLSTSLDEALAYLSAIQWSLLGASLLVSLLALGVALLLSRAFTRPLEALMESTLAVGAGQYDHPVRVRSSDEIGLLAERFDQMRVALKANIQKLLEEERLRAEIEVERHRSLSEMVAGVAHEVNTPLGIVNQAASIFTETLTDETAARIQAKDPELGASVADLVEAARLMQGNIARASTLIQTFKTLSVRQIAEARETLDLPSLVREVVDLFTIRARRTKLAVTVADGIRAGQGRWEGYPGYLTQVLMNLLANAQRYAYPPDQGGPVEVELAAEDQGPSGPFVLTVRDRGAGIAPEHLGRVFDVFFTTGRDRGGSGLGLAIVKNLVTTALGGTITVESQPGQGAAFTVRFPRVAPGEA